MAEAKKTGGFRSMITTPKIMKEVRLMLGMNTVKMQYVQNVPTFREVVVAAPSYDSPGSAVPFDGALMFPNETVIYLDKDKDMVVSTDYDETLIRPLPIYVIALSIEVALLDGNKGKNTITPIVLYRGHDKTGPIYGSVDRVDRQATGTLNNHAYDTSAPFATTVINIGTHLSRQKCEFEFRTGTPSDPSTITLQKFEWKQCAKDVQVVELCATRAVDAHDWSWYGRGERAGMKLFHRESGDVMAVYVAAKRHSRMNPVMIAAKVRWLESARWTEELKLAAFLALITYGQMSRRITVGLSAY